MIDVPKREVIDDIYKNDKPNQKKLNSGEIKSRKKNEEEEEKQKKENEKEKEKEEEKNNDELNN